MGVWIKDRATGQWDEWEYRCTDTWENPMQKGYAIDSYYTDKKRTIRKIVAIDKQGNEHPIKFLKKQDIPIV